MKALLIAAALALPVLATADDTRKDTGLNKNTTPQTGTTSTTTTPAGKDDAFSETKVINKIHHVNAKHIELGQLVQTRGGTDKIRKFGDNLVKDHQKLDRDVLSYAQKRGITFDESLNGQVGVTGDPQQGNLDRTATGGKADESATGATASGGVNAPGNPGGSSATNRSGSQMGTATPNSYGTSSGSGSAFEKSGSSTTGSTASSSTGSGATGNQDRVGSTGSQGGSGSSYDQSGSTTTTSESTVARSGSTGNTVGSTGTVAMPSDDFQSKLDALKSLQGAELDSRFLSNVIDNTDRAVSRLQSWKGMGEKDLDKLIDRSVKVLQDHRTEAQKLQQRTPAAS